MMNEKDMALVDALGDTILNFARGMKKELFMSMMCGTIHAWCEENEHDPHEIFARMFMAAASVFAQEESAEDGGEA